MTLDPQMEWVLELIEKSPYPALHTVPPEEARRIFEETATKLDAEPAPMALVEDREIPGPGGGIPVRLYVPAETGVADPLLIYFHGGGWVVGSLETHDRVCRQLAAKSGIRVLSVDYRMGPEHKFPAAVEDAWAVLNHVGAHAATFGIDHRRIAVGGDSAGGNLAAVVTQMAKITAGTAPCFQLLIYPGTDMRGGYASRRELAEGYALTAKDIDYFRTHYLREDADALDPRASPLLRDALHELPPAHVQTAGYDPLKDEGIAYVEKMCGAGVPVEHKHYPGLIHGYFNMSGAIDAAKAALDDACAALRKALHG